MFTGCEEDEGKEAFQEEVLKVKEALEEAVQEAFQEAFKVKEALQEAFKVKEALEEAFQEAVRLQELRGFVPLYGRDESFRYGRDGD